MQKYSLAEAGGQSGLCPPPHPPIEGGHVQMWDLDHKENEHWRIDALEMWFGEDSWESLGQQGDPDPILKEINSEYSLEGLMLKLKLQYSGHLMQRANSLEKTLMLGKIEGQRRKGQQRMKWLDSITDSMDIKLRKLREMVEDRRVWHVTVHGIPKSRTKLSNWTTVAWERLGARVACVPSPPPPSRVDLSQ